jgi:hypothetical protein
MPGWATRSAGAESDNRNDREFAASILFDIGTREAVKYLKTLSHDPDRQVALYAKNYVKDVGKQPSVDAVETEDIPLPRVEVAP